MTKTLITAAQLAKFAPRCDAARIAPTLDEAARRFGIDTPREIRHWMATLHHESGGFTRLAENLNYSAKRLTEVWPSRFRTLAAAAPYANSPQKLANFVYGGRLGNTGPNDGWLYRGSSWGQTTGKNNFRAASADVGVDLVKNPDYLRTFEGAAVAAGSFWAKNGFNDIVAPDVGEALYAKIQDHLRFNEEDDLVQAREKYNGARKGLDDVRNQLVRAALIWGK